MKVFYIFNNINLEVLCYLKNSIHPRAELTFQHTKLVICCLLRGNASTNWKIKMVFFCGNSLQTPEWFYKVRPYEVRLFPEKYSWLAEKLQRLTIMLYLQYITIIYQSVKDLRN